MTDALQALVAHRGSLSGERWNCDVCQDTGCNTSRESGEMMGVSCFNCHTGALHMAALTEKSAPMYFNAFPEMVVPPSALLSGFRDDSWGNDMSPAMRFTDESEMPDYLTLWVASPESLENYPYRYLVTIGEETELYAGSDLSAALRLSLGYRWRRQAASKELRALQTLWAHKADIPKHLHQFIEPFIKT